METPSPEEIKTVAEGYVFLDGTDRLKVKFPLWKGLSKLKGAPFASSEEVYSPLSRMTPEVFSLMETYPLLIEEERAKKRSFFFSKELLLLFQKIQQRKRETMRQIETIRAELALIPEKRDKARYVFSLNLPQEVNYLCLSRTGEKIGWDDLVGTKRKRLLAVWAEELEEREKIRDYSFVVYGDRFTEHTRDIDLAIFTSSLAARIEDYDLEGLREQLLSLGYPPLPLDINLLVVDGKGKLRQMFKGGKEIQSIIFYTYDLHPQLHPNRN